MSHSAGTGVYIATNAQIKMQAINEEMLSMIALANLYGFIPTGISEIEWTVDSVGQATIIEYWPTGDRIDEQRVNLHIPAEHRHKFVFNQTASLFRK